MRSSDDALYDTVFATLNCNTLILQVYIPMDFSRAPFMYLYGVRASHDWLDTHGKIVGYDLILTDARWSSSNLKLGDAVYAVIHHFQLKPYGFQFPDVS